MSVQIGKTVYEVISEIMVGGKKAWGVKAGNTIKTLCESTSMTGWALWGRNPAGKITMSCPNLVKFL